MSNGARASQQWVRRDGYVGPESFLEDGFAYYAVGQTDALSYVASMGQTSMASRFDN